MKLQIPSNFPVDIFKEKWLVYKKDNQINRLDTLYIILNEFTRNNIKIGWFEGVPLNNEALRAVCGKNFDQVKKDLLSLEEGKAFFTNDKYDPGFSSKWYKLGMKYCYSGFIEIELSSKERHKKYLSYLNGERTYRKEIQKIEPKLHLESQFNNLKITLNESVFDYKYIYINKYRELIRAEKNPKIKFLYYAKIGKIIDDINRLNNPNKYTYKLSDKNLRFNSIFTNINRELRYFVRHNGNRFIEFDFIASHCYVLATILNNEFFFNSNKDYSIANIYPDLLNRINSYIDASNKYNNNINHTQAQEVASRRVYHHMSDRFFEKDDIELYKSIDFENDFYGFVADIFNKIKPELPQMNRSKVKSIIRLWMNHTDPHKRNRVADLKVLNKIFPSIDLLIEEIGFFDKMKSAFSLLLQRSESHLILDIVGKKLVEDYPSIRLFTIHDSFFIEDINIDKNEFIIKIKQTLSDYVGVTPGIKLKESNPFDSLDSIIDEDLAEIKVKASKKENKIIDINKRIFSPRTIRLVELGNFELISRYGEDNIQEEFESFVNNLYPD
jgi:hypothetical protein